MIMIMYDEFKENIQFFKIQIFFKSLIFLLGFYTLIQLFIHLFNKHFSNTYYVPALRVLISNALPTSKV